MASLADAEEALRSTNDKGNFLRLTRLLMHGGVELLREKFDSYHSPANLPLKLGDPVVKNLLNKAKLSKPEWDALYPSPGTFGKSADFDITLTFRLLRTICSLTAPSTGWNNPPNSTDFSIEADLVRIKLYRNSVYGHNRKMEITDSDFHSLWKEISEALLRIAGSISNAKRDEWKKCVDKLLNDTLTPEAQRYADELEIWYRKDVEVKDSLEHLRDEIQQLKDQLQQVNQKFDFILMHIAVTSFSQGGQPIFLGQTPVVSETLQVGTGSNRFCAVLIREDQPGEHREENRQNPLTEFNIWKILLSVKRPFDLLLGYLKDTLGLGVPNYRVGSLLIAVTCSSLQVLERLWDDYSSGHLNQVVEQILVTPDALKKLGLTDLKMRTTIKEEEYKKCKDSLLSADEYNYFKMSRRSIDDVKSIAQSFVHFLEKNNLKQDMLESELKSIYELKYRALYSATGVSFSRVLHTLKYHLNLCQQLQDRVVFGGGEAAALRMLSIDDPDDSSSEEEGDEFSSMMRNPALRCKICKRIFQDDTAYRNHLETVSHRQQSILKKIRESVERPALVLDKNEIMVTSSPPGDENGVIELNVKNGERGSITLIVENTGTKEIKLKFITLLWTVNVFNYSDIKSIGPDRENLHKGKQSSFVIRCTKRSEYGYSYVPVVLTFEQKDGSEFHILRFLAVQIVSDLFDDLKPTSRYQAPRKAQRVPSDVKTTRGLPLPALQRDGLRMEKLERYDIPPTVMAQQGRDGLREQLQKPLTFDNYKDRFRLLLQLEEIQMQKDIRHYDMKEVVFEQDRVDRRFLTLEVPGLAENRPSVLRGDRIFAYEHGVRQHRYEGIVHKVQLLNVKLGFDMSKIPFVKGKKFDIQFTFNRLTVQMEHRACERIAPEHRKEMRQVLFPQQESLVHRAEINKQVGGGSFYDRNLNSQQQQAVQKILSGSSRPAPYLVFGPPGTGKTVTLVEAIKQVHSQIESSVILACAPENSAADLLAERLLAHVDKGKLFRMYAASRAWDFLSQPLKDARVVNFDPVSREVFYPSKEDLMKNYRIIVTTLVTAGRLVSAVFPRNHFTHIFIDEAGHATEPECIIPVADLLDPNHPRGGQLVLAGDPKQLGPIVRSKTTQEHGFGISLLERLMTSCNTYEREPNGGYNPNLLTKLVNNYRSHRDIIEIPKQLFYENELNECAGDFRNVMLDWEELPNKKFPMIFHSVYGKDEREENSPSFFNIPEVETVERYLKKLLDDKVRSKRLKHLKPEMVGIISPYKKQVQKIQKMIEKRGLGSKIKVGSVEEFQGQERRVIILSTVRSTNKEYLDMDKEFHLGFLDNPKRFNVAITRAQALLIVIGNPDMLCMDMNWARLLEYCNENNAWVGVERKNEVEDIANTLRKLNLYPVESSEVGDSEVSQLELQEHPEWTRHE